MAEYEQWLRNGYHGDMHYLENHLDLRRDPRLLLPGAKTVVSLAISYDLAGLPTQPGLALYAQGRDYHEVVKERLKALLQKIRTLPQPSLVGKKTLPLPSLVGRGQDVSSPESEEVVSPESGNVTTPSLQGRAGGGSEGESGGSEGESGGSEGEPEGSSPPKGGWGGRICVDTAPIMEKYWAWRCGLGWIGRNRQLIIPHEGSAFFLAELLLAAEADHYSLPLREGRGGSFCGRCHRCLDACPTGALSEEGLDARRCLSYLTIEHRGPLPDDVRPHLSECFYGCDRCMRACPHYRPQQTPVPEFRPSEQLLNMQPADWQQLTPEQYRELFRGSAVKRAKYEGLLRNIGTQAGEK